MEGRGIIAALGLVFTCSIAVATDSVVTGLKIKMSDDTQPGVARRKVLFGSKDVAISIPADGSAGDPSLHGGSVEIFNSAGSGESDIYALPTGGWRRIPANPLDPLRGWKYKEVVANPPTDDHAVKVVMRIGSSYSVLRVIVKDDRGTFIAYTLDEPMQGSLGVRIATGTDRHCADFAAGVLLADESVALGGGVYRGTFAAKLAPAPADCD
jgi:hypothetical protein